MAKIKNMGTATMRFGEGVIVTGNASNPDGSDSGFNLIVSGNVKIAEGSDLIFQKGESETSFIQFKNDDDGSSYNAYFAYQAAEHIYISPGRGADFYLQQRTNIGGDPYTFPFRVFDDGRVKFEKGQSDGNASATDLPDDVNFYVSGSINTGQDLSVFGGGVLVSGSLNVGGTITTTNDISFQDNGGTFPTNTAGFFWDLNNDEARIYAKQPASDQIDFVFKLSDNNNSVDRFVYWIDDYRGGSYDRYPLVMHGEGVFFQSPESSEGVPNIGNSKARFDSNGRLAFNCQNQTDPSLLLNHAHIYSKLDGGTAEMFVRDSDGNVTKISPHTPEGEWEYFSRNTRTGKVVRVNMEKMIRKLEKITGESFMEEWYEDPTDQ